MKLGITRHKCATIAEAEMLADVGVEDVLLAYQMVGPNLVRLVKLIDKFPGDQVRLFGRSPRCRVCSCQKPSRRDGNQSRSVDVMLDLDSGMNRTGISIGHNAIELYEMILSADGLNVGGSALVRRTTSTIRFAGKNRDVNAGWNQLIQFRDQLLLSGLKVPRIVTAGTGSFPILAGARRTQSRTQPRHDHVSRRRYGDAFSRNELLSPALGILTRVISRNHANHLTLDVGHKSCAADQPVGHRLAFPELADAKEVMHSEEHLVIETTQADQFHLGDHLIAIPRHACPASAVHPFANVIAKGKIVERWQIAARDRILNI